MDIVRNEEREAYSHKLSVNLFRVLRKPALGIVLCGVLTEELAAVVNDMRVDA